MNEVVNQLLLYIICRKLEIRIGTEKKQFVINSENSNYIIKTNITFVPFIIIINTILKICTLSKTMTIHTK